MATDEDIQRRYREFLDLLPLTLALAGLPQSERGKYFSEEQIDGRTITVKHAYESAKKMAWDSIDPS